MGACKMAVGQFEARTSEYSGVPVQTNRPHVVPLVPEAVAILENSFRSGKGDYVLSTTEGERPIRGLAKFYKTRLPEAILKQSEAVISPFSPHDVRRSGPSRIAESLGIGGEPLVRRLLGHADSSVP